MRVPVSIATLFPGIVLPVLLLVISLPAASQEALPDKPQSWVSDYAGVLSAPQKQEMDGRLADLQNRTSTQIFVAVFPEIPDGYALEDFCTRLYEKWGIGRKEVNNGVLLAVFMKDRKIRIETGYGLEDVLTDAQAKRVIENYITPQFRQGNFGEGISDGLTVIMAAVEGKYQIPMEPEEDQEDGFPVMLIIFIIILIIIISSRRRNSATYSRRGGRTHTWGGGPWIGGGFGGGGFGGGSSGGGFSGGFGGMSGGGGASGGW